MYINILRPSAVHCIKQKQANKQKGKCPSSIKCILAFETKSNTIYTTNELCMQYSINYYKVCYCSLMEIKSKLVPVILHVFS